MMKTKSILKNLLLLCCLFVVTACSDDRENPTPGVGQNALLLNYSLLGADLVDTYALPPEPHETTIGDIYTLFFRDGAHATGANQYVGYTVSRATSTGTSTGSSRITLPAGEVVDDAWQFIFIANLDKFADLNGQVDVDAWLNHIIPSTTLISAARPKLMAFFDKKAGLKDPFLMSGEKAKIANVNIVNVELSRGVARVDVVNATPAGNFVLESAELWNARTRTPILAGQAPVMGTSANDFQHYTDNVVTTNSGEIKAKLYAFENTVITPVKGDKVTTCLILAGRWNGNPTSYYRVNVSPQGAQQVMKRNGAYTIKLDNVTANGENDKDDAFNNDDAKLTYSINEWDNSYLGHYIFDADGNGLAVSQNQVVFSENGGQEVEIEVYQIKSTSTPPSSMTWTVQPITGTNASEFTATEITPPGQKKFKIRTNTDNPFTTDREATVVIKWGTIKCPVKLAQLNPTSSVKGLKVIPSSVWFEKTPSIYKEIILSMEGNFTGVTDANIGKSILYQGTSTGSTGWLNCVYVSNPADEANGLFHYRITASNLASVLPALNSREANIKFAVTQGAKIMTATCNIRQTLSDEVEEIARRELTISTFYEGVNKGNTSTAYALFKGMPTGTTGLDHLHFAINDKALLHYELVSRSGMRWVIKSNSQTLLNNLTISQMSGGGNASLKEVFTIRSNKDIIADNMNMDSGWSGLLYIEYENGDKTELYAHQTGCLKKLDAYGDYKIGIGLITDGSIYYYGTTDIGTSQWLDRYIGAETSDPALTSVSDIKHGKMLTGMSLATACPKGFKIPSADNLQDQQAMESLWNAAVFIPASGVLNGITHPYKNRWALQTSAHPAKFVYLNSITMRNDANILADAIPITYASGANGTVKAFSSFYLGHTLKYTSRPNSELFAIHPAASSSIKRSYIYGEAHNLNRTEWKKLVFGQSVGTGSTNTYSGFLTAATSVLSHVGYQVTIQNTLKVTWYSGAAIKCLRE